MEIVIIEKTAFEMLLAGVKALEDRVRTLAEKGGDRRLAEWMDTEDVCRMLCITPKTLQTMRDRHDIAYSTIGRKFYYRPEDVERLLPDSVAEKTVRLTLEPGH